MSAMAFSTSTATLAMSRPSVLSCTLKTGIRSTWFSSTAPLVRWNFARLDSFTGVDCLTPVASMLSRSSSFDSGVVGVLHRHEVLVAALHVDPEIAVEGDAGVQGGHRLLDDFLGRQSRARRLLAIDLDHQIRSVETLEDAGIGHAGNRTHPVPHFVGHVEGVDLLAARDLDVDGRGGPVVQRRRDHTAGVEADAQVGQADSPS